jgi:Na+/melibiose symporter-like transporter
MLCSMSRERRKLPSQQHIGRGAMSLGTILIIIVIIYLIGGFSGRFGGYGYGMGHSGLGIGGVILVVLIVLLLLGKL